METRRDAERERGIFHLLIPFPDGHNSQSLVKLKPDSRRFFWVSHVGPKVQELGPGGVA